MSLAEQNPQPPSEYTRSASFQFRAPTAATISCKSRSSRECGTTLVFGMYPAITSYTGVGTGAGTGSVHCSIPA